MTIRADRRRLAEMIAERRGPSLPPDMQDHPIGAIAKGGSSAFQVFHKEKMELQRVKDERRTSLQG